jgi:lipid A 3-O-deacylase
MNRFENHRRLQQRPRWFFSALFLTLAFSTPVIASAAEPEEPHEGGKDSFIRSYEEGQPQDTGMKEGTAASDMVKLGSEPSDLLSDDRGTFTFIWENDIFGGTDRNYTNGNRISYLSPTQTISSFPAEAARFLLGADGTDNVRYGLAIGHSIYTPEDTDVTTPLPEQHPYAGYLYAEGALQVERPDTLDTLTVQLGVVGPAAGGKSVQNNFHSLIGADEAKGWSNQLKNEPAFLISFDRSFRALAELEAGGFGMDLTPSIGATLGNVQTQAQVGLMARIGQDLRSDFGPPRVRPALAGGGFFNPRNEFSWYLFAGVAGRAVAYDIFLDGNLFRSGGPSVDRRPLVADFQVGIAAQWGDLQLAYTFVTRTEEFESQGGRQQFGAFSASYKF